MLPVTTPFDAVSCSSVNSAWGTLTIEVLVRLGVETVITSPGARSAPLTLAAARNARVEALSILDERSAAFFALGIAKRTHRPVALISTSGTAAANYLPAVIEASLRSQLKHFGSCFMNSSMPFSRSTASWTWL